MILFNIEAISIKIYYNNMKRNRNSLHTMNIQIKTSVREGIKRNIFNDRNATYLDLVGRTQFYSFVKL